MGEKTQHFIANVRISGNLLLIYFQEKRLKKDVIEVYGTRCQTKGILAPVAVFLVLYKAGFTVKKKAKSNKNLSIAAK